MGHQSRARRPATIHRKQLFGGRETAAEVHARLGWRGRCSAHVAGPPCGGTPVIRIMSFMPVTDFRARAPWIAEALIAPRVVRMTYGPMVRIGKVLACAHHRQEAERAAARAPSCVLVEIDRGPGAERPVVQV